MGSMSTKDLEPCVKAMYRELSKAFLPTCVFVLMLLIGFEKENPGLIRFLLLEHYHIWQIVGIIEHKGSGTICKGGI